MKLTERMRTALTLSAFAVLFLTLVTDSFTRKSATWDEPQHLTAGYEARARRDYRFDSEHPPFLRLWAALPVHPTATITNCPVPQRGESWLMLYQFVYAHEFLYRLNDADRLLYQARFMNALWGVLLGVLLFSFARERFGYWPAVGALTLYTVEPNILAHAGLVTTDFGITCFVFGTIYFLWRTQRKPTLLNFGGLTLFFALAQISKFTGVLLVPVIGIGLIVGVARKRFRIPQVIGVSVAIVLATYLTIWASYSFRFAPGPNGGEYLIDSNLDWGQDLKGLQQWQRAHNVTHINLSYFGTADPAYYGINATPILGAPFYIESQAPQLPGYVAVSETNLRGVYLDEPGRAFYRPLLALEPVATIGYSIRIYWLDRPWW